MSSGLVIYIPSAKIRVPCGDKVTFMFNIFFLNNSLEPNFRHKSYFSILRPARPSPMLSMMFQTKFSQFNKSNLESYNLRLQGYSKDIDVRKQDLWRHVQLLCPTVNLFVLYKFGK